MLRWSLARSCGCCEVDCGNRLADMSADTLVVMAVGDNPTGTGVCCDESHADVHRRPYSHTSDDGKNMHIYIF